MKTLHLIQHVEFEGPGQITHWARARGVALAIHALHRGATLPAVGPTEGIAFMGGPMNIYQDDLHPWLAAERQYLHQLVATEVPIIGFCLGAQLLADALGARVYKNEVAEMGWLPVQLTDDLPLLLGTTQREIEVFHWHEDTFGLPPGATRLASSRACQNQAFRLGRALGLQFHLEVGTTECVQMLQHGATDLKIPSATVHAAPQILRDTELHSARAAQWLHQLLDAHLLGRRP